MDCTSEPVEVPRGPAPHLPPLPALSPDLLFHPGPLLRRLAPCDLQGADLAVHAPLQQGIWPALCAELADRRLLRPRRPAYRAPRPHAHRPRRRAGLRTGGPRDRSRLPVAQPPGHARGTPLLLDRALRPAAGADTPRLHHLRGAGHEPGLQPPDPRLPPWRERRLLPLGAADAWPRRPGVALAIGGARLRRLWRHAALRVLLPRHGHGAGSAAAPQRRQGAGQGLLPDAAPGGARERGGSHLRDQCPLRHGVPLRGGRRRHAAEGVRLQR
mmetsp:Transcript_141267/g.393704  ORF Transcript_141267/g.393704 Transcript_141267/m.393704 type:complete len:271 (+) Transcript_141267:357-1169(+)